MADRRRTSLLAVAVAALLLLVAAGSDARVQPALAAEPGDVHFTAAGDFSTSAAAGSVLSGMGAADAQLNLALGDLSYGVPGQEQSFCDFVTSRVGPGRPFELVSGNHESNGEDGNINDFAACLPNQVPGVVGTYGRQWYVDYPAQQPVVRFLMISPGLTFADGLWDYAVGSPRYQWTSAAIDGARAAGIPWVVAGMHRPCLSTGEYDCSGMQDITALLLRKRVDLVLNGHEHLYERTKQLALGAGCPVLTTNGYDSDCVVDSDDDLVKGAGTVSATVGTGGVTMRDVHPADSEAPYFARLQGANTNNTYGYLDVQADHDQLRASFVSASGAGFAESFTITRADPPTNNPPVADFASPSCTALVCTFDASASFDTDGYPVAWHWDFGDGGTADGSSVQHTFAGSGTFPVTLTVTDDGGGSASTARDVSVSDAPVAVVADDFSRTVSGGWGSANTGGPWTIKGSTSLASVAGGVGVLRVAAANGSTGANLNAPSVLDSTTTLSLASDKPATVANGILVFYLARQNAAGSYRARVRISNDAKVRLDVGRATAGGAFTALGAAVVAPGITYAPGDRLMLKVQVSGTSPTTLRAKVWRVGTSEPVAWQVERTDSTAGLQAAGGVGLLAKLAASTSNGPVSLSFDDLAVLAP